jgi:hypothetical protein
MYKRYETTLGTKTDGTALASTPLSGSKSQRLVAAREFYWASAYNRESTASTTVTLRYKSSSTVSDAAAIRIDSVVLLAGESAVWTYEDYGFDMAKTGYVELVASGTQDVDLAIRTRDRLA